MNDIYVYYYNDEDMEHMGTAYEKGRCYGYNKYDNGVGLKVENPTAKMLENIADHIVINGMLMYQPIAIIPDEIADMEELQKELHYKDAQIQALSKRADFMEDVIAEMATVLYV